MVCICKKPCTYYNDCPPYNQVTAETGKKGFPFIENIARIVMNEP